MRRSSRLRAPRGRPAGRRVAGAAIGVVALVVLGFASPVAGSSVPDISFASSVGGQPSSTSSDAHPAPVRSNGSVTVAIRVTNHGEKAVHLSTLSFAGEVLDLTLFSYDTPIDFTIPAKQTRSLTIPISTLGVGNQVTGLVEASVTLFGSNGNALATQTLVTQVHGSLRSVYGLFGLGVLGLTLMTLLLALLALAQHRLSDNRWRRALRFAIPGFGTGLVLIFTMSAFNVFTPGPGHWLPLLFLPTAVGLLLGFLTPAPNEEEFDDYDDDVLLAEIMVVDEDPIATSSSGVQRVTAAPSGVPDTRATQAP